MFTKKKGFNKVWIEQYVAGIEPELPRKLYADAAKSIKRLI